MIFLYLRGCRMFNWNEGINLLANVEILSILG
ncbi:hypothetical protein AAKU67_004515 [Oxalobacteraceae bacterium GrIS 2.11]